MDKYIDTEVYDGKIESWVCNRCGCKWYDTSNIEWLECPECGRSLVKQMQDRRKELVNKLRERGKQ